VRLVFRSFITGETTPTRARERNIHIGIHSKDLTGELEKESERRV
jgi:hypothetical protein